MPTKKKIPKVKLLDFSDNCTANLNELKINEFFSDLITDPDKKEYFNTRNIVIGIDEAGRGPVIGPLLYGLVLFTESHNLNDQDLGGLRLRNSQFSGSTDILKSDRDMPQNIIIKDSKEMSKSQRTDTHTFLRQHFPCATLSLDARFITSEMERRSLNDICLWAVIQLLKFVDERIFKTEKKKLYDSPTIKKGIRTMSGKFITQEKKNQPENIPYTAHKSIITVIIDSLGSSVVPLLTLQSNFPNFTFKILPKADSLFQVVSAASIVAKVERDMAISDIMTKHINDGCICLNKEAILQRNVPYTVINSRTGKYKTDSEPEMPQNPSHEKLKGDLAGLLTCNGYPSDPHISLYLKRFPKCPFIRFKWATVTRGQPKKKPMGLLFRKKNK